MTAHNGEPSMPIIRSILNLGNSKAVTIPKSWLTNAEDQTGKKVIALAMDVNESITLQPIFEKEHKPVTQRSP
jgi:antitoxin component of MazEF toxin-antitoxin module